MPTLELVIDATGMQRGAQQAETALKSVSTTAERTATSVQSTGRALSTTFQVTQGGVQIAHGIGQTALAFQQLNLAAAGFAGARTLLEIGQTATQFSVLRAGAGAASGAMLALGRAIPYVGLALSAGTALYAIFGGAVSDTTHKINDQVDALGRLQAKIGETTIRAGYGQADPRTSVGGTVDVLTALRLSDRRQFSARDAAALFGVSEQELRYALARARLGEAALELQPNPTIQGRQVYPGGAPFRMQAFTQDQIVGAGEDILRQRRAPPPLPSQANGAWEVQEAGRMSRSWAAAEQAQAQAIAQKQAEADKAHLEALERQVALATQVGAALGAGVYDVLAGIQSWRQAISQIVGQFARQGLSSLGASLFNSTARQLTGTTEPTGGPSYGSDL